MSNEQNEQTEEQLDADFESGFTAKTDTELTETPEEVAVEVVEPAAEAAPVIKYAQITEDQLTNLLNKAAAVDGLQADTQRKLDGAFGKIGNLQQVIERLQSNTGSGEKVELTEEDMREISDQYPDLGKSMLKTLQNVVGKLKGTGTAAPFDLSSIDQRVQQHIAPQLDSMTTRIRQEIAAEELAETFPNWKEIAGAPGSNTEFRQWLAKQPNNRAQQVLESNRAQVISKAMADFTNSKKQIPKSNSRTERLKEAITPKGEGNHTATSTEDDDFVSGFKGVKQY